MTIAAVPDATGFAQASRSGPMRKQIVRNRGYCPSMATARFPSIVIDCPDAAALAAFYSALLGWKSDVQDDWADIRADYGQCISFQQVDDYTPPQWPKQEVPQQMHLDLVVDDLDTAEAAVLQLGGTKHEHQPGTTFRVFLDPAGHPFCLCLN
jgi:predicted enzyme related to lactoylglutathione lyase